MLVHQAKRLQSPSAIITNHDAAIMPNLQITSADGATKMNLKFDPILCEVIYGVDAVLKSCANANVPITASLVVTSPILTNNDVAFLFSY